MQPVAFRDPRSEPSRLRLMSWSKIARLAATALAAALLAAPAAAQLR